jgi:hypothetical protein
MSGRSIYGLTRTHKRKRGQRAMRRGTSAALAAMVMGVALLHVVRAEEPRTISFRVEHGDTFTNLFGSDWQKAYEQNKLTVFRRGRPITSPDILIEGMIVRVSSDVGLTPRAVARCGELRERRDQLSAKLVALEQRLSDDTQARETAAETRRLLEDEMRFAADIDFAARQIEYLEEMTRRPAIPVPEKVEVRPMASDGLLLYVSLVLLACAALAGAFYVTRRRERPRYPEADARYREVIADLKGAFRSVGEKF